MSILGMPGHSTAEGRTTVIRAPPLTQADSDTVRAVRGCRHPLGVTPARSTTGLGGHASIAYAKHANRNSARESPNPPRGPGHGLCWPIRSEPRTR